MLQASVQTDTTPGARPQPWPSLHGDNIFKITYLNNDKFKLLWIVFKFFFSSFQIESGKKIYSFSSEVCLYVVCCPPPGVVTTPLVPDYSRHVNVWGHPGPAPSPSLLSKFSTITPRSPGQGRGRDILLGQMENMRNMYRAALVVRSPHSTGLAVLTAKKYFHPCMKLARYNCSNILKLF